MERDEIERHDFPAARRGYDPAAVDAHLRRVADEFERSAARPAGSLAEGASAQVRAILEAAETSAQQLRDDAGREAAATSSASRTPRRTCSRSSTACRTELDRLLGGLKSTAETLAGSLGELSRDVGTLGGQRPDPEPRPPPTGARSDDEAGARLVALNMALEGTPREDTARFLAEHYELGDVDALLDDVYTSAGR